MCVCFACVKGFSGCVCVSGVCVCVSVFLRVCGSFLSLFLSGVCVCFRCVYLSRSVGNNVFFEMSLFLEMFFLSNSWNAF